VAAARSDADAEANFARVQAELEWQLKAARKWKQRAADAEERQRAAIEARDADAEANLARVQADLERQLKAAGDDMEARVALKDAAGTRSRETHEAEIGKVRAELGKVLAELGAGAARGRISRRFARCRRAASFSIATAEHTNIGRDVLNHTQNR
jgi:hypothetical protein